MQNSARLYQPSQAQRTHGDKIMVELEMYAKPKKLSTTKKIQVSESMDSDTAAQFNVSQVSVIPPSGDHSGLLAVVSESMREKLENAIEKQRKAELKKERAAELKAAGGANLSCELGKPSADALSKIMVISGLSKKQCIENAVQKLLEFYEKDKRNGDE